MNIHPQKYHFDEPLSTLRECHQQVEHFLRMLQELVRKAPADRLPSSCRASLERILDFFSTAVARHITDEEESLYPRLRTDPLADLIIDKLEADHERFESLHRTVELLCQQWLLFGSLECSERCRLRKATEELAQLSQEHIKIEEERLFPLATGRLGPEIFHQIRAEMASRHS